MRRSIYKAPRVLSASLPCLLFLFVTVGLVGCGTDSTVPDQDAQSGLPDAGLAQTEAGSDAHDDAAALRVLFVGNSYTYVNDLPSVIHALGAATAGAAVSVESVTEGGATLETLWTAGIASARIASGGFDVVVLQGNSLETYGTAEFFYPYAQLFAEAARNAGTRVVWYETWARRADDPVYADGLTTPDFMTRSIDHAYRHAADQWGGTVARIGAAWQLALAEDPGVELYADDGSHPSPSGTLLSACTMFLALTGKEAVLADPIPLGIDRPTATALCGLAPRVLCGPRGCGCENATQVSTTYTALDALVTACDGSTERRGLECNAAMNAACAVTSCANAGFGLAPTTGDSVALTCVEGAPLDSTFTALRALDPSCDGTTERYGAACATAIDLACRASGALSGFGPTAASGDDVTVTCVQPANALREHLEFTYLSPFEGYCDGVGQFWGADCDVAIDSFCRQHGFAGGFGPTATVGTGGGGSLNIPVRDGGIGNGAAADFVCVAW